ncbi:MAG: zinc-dependent metalloprotease family protein [Pseudomonadota bacterium]|nr:zinc-dependent metalloprotease family protein [Pseudomonadota bacterium]
MKFTRIAVCLSVALVSCVSAANAAESLFSVAGNRSQIAEPGELLRKAASDPANERIEIVSARANLIAADTRVLSMSLPGGINVDARQTQFERMESGNEVWIGQIDMGHEKLSRSDGLIPLDAALNNIIAVRSGNTLLANIRIEGQLYRLVPIDDGAHALIEVDQSKFLVDEDEKGYTQMLRNSPRSDGAYAGFGPVAKAISTIRVMVAFGASATAAVGNEQQAMDLAFAEANQALSATNTDIRFQQAGAIRFYTQSESTNYSTMLNRLTNDADGFYDAIAGQRNSSTADIVAYVAPSSASLCGQAAGIATSSANAYFVMNHTCLSGNFTFVHEAGHVVGTRHDNDSTTSPFSYGHGFVMSSINRRTVMAVNNGPCSSCTRFGAFSSPNYTLSGVTIGTASFNDNNRVWRSRGPTVAGFR